MSEANRVLIVDDALIMRKKIREIAEAAGWRVAAEAGDGRQALEAYRRELPDLVTMDIVMPVMDGVEALKALLQEHPQARVVMVSAVNQKGKLSDCVRSGAVDFIVKPFDDASLRAFFQKQLRREPDAS